MPVKPWEPDMLDPHMLPSYSPDAPSPVTTVTIGGVERTTTTQGLLEDVLTLAHHRGQDWYRGQLARFGAAHRMDLPVAALRTIVSEFGS